MWTNEQISDFQLHNNAALAEINATLRPDKYLKDKVGIFCQGQLGDTATVMSVLKYRDVIFPSKQIVWYINSPNCDILRYAPISEVRPWPWPGNGLPFDSGGDFYPLLCDENNRLNKDLAKHYELTADLFDGYFPAAWQLPAHKRHGIDYPNVSRKVFGIPGDWQWHPLLSFSDEEREAAKKFVEPMRGKIILMETFAGSGQSLLDENMISETMNICTQNWGKCNFIFASHKFLRADEKFPAFLFETSGIYSAADFTVRQCALIAEQTDLMISVSSGISVAASAWGLKPPPILQFCGSWICSTQSLANGKFELVTCDDKLLENAKKEFYQKLISLLHE